jgi:hypothetical protein
LLSLLALIRLRGIILRIIVWVLVAGCESQR